VPGWLTPAGVADYLGDATLADDPNLAAACTGLEAYLERLRSDVFGPTATPLGGWRWDAPPPVAPLSDPPAFTVPADLVLGGTLWAAHVYQLRSGPSGFAGYGDGAGDAMYDLSFASNRSDIWRLCGVKRPVAL
jgi:hypothetical protein